MADRQDLIRSAVAFLTDPKVFQCFVFRWVILTLLQAQASPLAQRVQFLEAKGLTGPEIEEAMRQANSSGPHHLQQPSYGPVYGPLPYVPPSQLPWDWRDYFVRPTVNFLWEDIMNSIGRSLLSSLAL
jgi:peroxin-14